MGCDIHATVEYDQYYQAKIESKEEAKHSFWDFAKSIDIDRNYALFNLLAGVRDCGVRPVISTPRGMPDNASFGFAEELDKWDGDAHSTSYVSFKELKDWQPEPESVKDFHWDVTDFRKEHWYRVLEMLAEDYGEENVRLCFFFDN